jgi:hypothetical protein
VLPLALLSTQTDEFTWRPERAEISTSGDLGYSYGTYESQTAKREKGIYVRMWKRGTDNRFKVVIDIQVPIPAQ